MQMTSNSCGCGCGATTTSSCSTAIAESPRYYPRQLITAADLTLEQNYFRDRMRRHNRLLHGWGVVCGALVCPIKNSDGTFVPWQVQVQTGFVLGPYGDEIIIDCARTVDLRTSGVSGLTGEPCIDVPDPWCTQVFNPPSNTGTLYIAVKYQQSMTRPVRVQPIGCGCDDTTCEYSRWRDGYEIGVLQSCPSCNACDESVIPIDKSKLFTGPAPSCPDCSCGPWVCLAAVTVAADGTFRINNCSCRRQVVSFADQWWRCTNPPVVDNMATPPIAVVADGKTSAKLTITGTNLQAHQGEIYSFGPDVTVAVSDPAIAITNPNSVTLSMTADASAIQGTRNLMIRNSDGGTAMLANAITIMPPGTGQSPPTPPPPSPPAPPPPAPPAPPPPTPPAPPPPAPPAPPPPAPPAPPPPAPPAPPAPPPPPPGPARGSGSASPGRGARRSRKGRAQRSKSQTLHGQIGMAATSKDRPRSRRGAFQRTGMRA